MAKVEAGGKRRAVRYQCGLGQEEVFLHPHSALYKAAPEFVVYSQLIRSAKRPYMAGDMPVLDLFPLNSNIPMGGQVSYCQRGEVARALNWHVANVQGWGKIGCLALPQGCESSV